jgi:hypothetical protein
MKVFDGLGRPALALALAACVLLACTPSVTPEPTAPEAAGLVVGCAGVEASECQAAAAQLLAALPPGRPRPFDIQLTLMGCAKVACPQTLVAQGAIAYVEYAGGLDTFTYTIGGDPWILGPLDDHFTDPIAPASIRVPWARSVSLRARALRAEPRRRFRWLVLGGRRGRR